MDALCVWQKHICLLASTTHVTPSTLISTKNKGSFLPSAASLVDFVHALFLFAEIVFFFHAQIIRRDHGGEAFGFRFAWGMGWGLREAMF